MSVLFISVCIEIVYIIRIEMIRLVKVINTMSLFCGHLVILAMYPFWGFVI